MNTQLNFTITPRPLNFSLNVFDFDPTIFNQDCKIETLVNGHVKSDGVSSFKETIVKAALLPQEEGYKLLFATGMVDGRQISGMKKIDRLNRQPLADPTLGWSLQQEKSQKTLQYIYSTYGVTTIEFMRRVIINRHSERCVFRLVRGMNTKGWECRLFLLNLDRGESCPALLV